VLTCGGGGFRPALWTQIRADVLGRPLARLQVNEPGLLGAAALAARGAGLFDTLAKAQQALARFEAPVLPDAARRGLYDDLFGLYTRAITANASLNAELLALAAQGSGLSENSP
jgi:sugar (pentulose or hexulose) kinase